MSDTLNQILTLIKQSYDIDPATIDPKKPLSEFGIDSLALAELLFAIEDHFRIEYPEERTNVQTLEEVVRVVDDVRERAAVA